MIDQVNGKSIYGFADFRLETGKQALLRQNLEIHLPKRHFQILQYLIENREYVVSRDELLDKFWDGHKVYDDVLTKVVAAIRSALGDQEKPPRFIETKRGSGYRFVGAVVEEDGENGRRGEKGKRRRVLIGVFAVALILFVVFSFSAYRRQPANLVAKTLAETVAAKRSIAILPIRNLTGDTANDYLSDGITESLINDVSRIETLTVISRGSAFQFKNKDASPEEIGQRLGVETILEGGLRKSGDDLRVEVRLVNTKDGRVMWASDSDQKKLADIFAIQDGITCQIVTELRVKLCGEMAPAERYTKNVKAYQLYLKGLYYRNQGGKDNLLKAIGFFERALIVDTHYALAHEGLAGAYVVLESNSDVAPGTAAPKAEFHAQRALELDDSLAGAYIYLGTARTINNYDINTRDKYYEQALLKNPNHRTGHLWLANDFTVQGKFEDAEREILRVQELDPLSPAVHLHLAELYFYWHKPDKAIEQASQIIAESPNNETALGLIARSHAQKGAIADALAVMEKLPANDGSRAMVLASAGKTDEARKIIEAIIASEKANVSPYYIGCLYAAIGERETAFAWLEKSYAVRQADLVSIKVDPALDSLRSDARYADLLKRVYLE